MQNKALINIWIEWGDLGLEVNELDRNIFLSKVKEVLKASQSYPETYREPDVSQILEFFRE